MLNYKILYRHDDLKAVWEKIQAESLAWALWPQSDVTSWTSEDFCQRVDAWNVLMLGAFVGRDLAGLMRITPLCEGSNAAEIGVVAFRQFFPRAAAMCLGAMQWAVARLKASAFVGYVPKPHRHVLAMCGRAGFSTLGIVPEMFWHDRKKGHVDGVVVMATPESIWTAMEDCKDEFWRW